MQLAVEKLALGYEGRAIISDLNFEVKEGDYLCIVGENGSGKSTLMKTLLGLVPPKNGKILFGEGIKQREIGYLPQQSLAQRDFPASVREVVLSGFQGACGFRPFYTKEEKQLASVNMRKMGIYLLRDSSYRNLSGGQQQRALLARALCASRKMLLLDEPVSGLDPMAAEDMYELIESLNRESDITIIMISHDMEASLKYASHILHIGEDVFFGTRDEFTKSDVYRRIIEGISSPGQRGGDGA